jgi:asparagine synthase (glutamine-hydrolysing)
VVVTRPRSTHLSTRWADRPRDQMSGITGLVSLNGAPVDRRVVRRMVEAMPHRGPDGRTTWCEGSVGLGHCMLMTTPESLYEEQPVRSLDGRYTVTADARLDNREELLALLRPRRVGGREPTDSELILEAYMRWGDACVDHLLGDFAFAVWDSTERRLFCARDHLGVRPLSYHYASGGVFAFGTEIKAILEVPGVPRRLNEQQVADYLVGMREDAESTIYADILRLAPGHLAVVDATGLRVRRYYELEPATDVGPDWTDERYAERFHELFQEAVRSRLRSAYPIGSELSGGLDSSYVTCVARDILREGGRDPLHTISLVFDRVSSCDERPYIDAVLAGGGVQPHFAAGDSIGPLSNLEEVYDVLDDGVVGNNQQLRWVSLGVAREAGVRVLLDGLDGDLVVGHGHSYLGELARAWQMEGIRGSRSARV